MTDPFALRLLADRLPEPILLVSAAGRVQFANEAAAALLGWPLSDLAGADLSETLSSPRDAFEAYLRRCRSTASMLPGSLVLRTRQGQPVRCRAEGCRFAGAAFGGEPLVLVRLLHEETAVARFTALTQRLGDLTAEIRRRRIAETQAAETYRELVHWQTRQSLLAEAPTMLLASLQVEEIYSAIGEIAARLLPADAHAIWRFEPGPARWAIVWQHGLSPGFVSEVLGWMGQPSGAVPFTTPLVVPDVHQVPLLAERQAAYHAEGVRSMLAIPLTIDRQQHGTLVSYFRALRAFTDADVRAATGFGSLCSAVLTTAELYRREAGMRAAAELSGRRAQFLARASAVLVSSLEYDQTLRAVAELAVPEIADWCAIDLVDGDGTRRVAMAHADPAHLRLAQAITEKYPETPDSPFSAATVLRTRQPARLGRVTDEMMIAGARSPEHLQLLRDLGLTSIMRVPLLGHGAPLGVLTFASAESRAEYDEGDVQFAESVAARMALAVENAQAYQAARRANRLKDEFLATLSHELRTPLNAIVGYSRLLLGDTLPEDRRTGALQAVERNAVALTQIVEDVLDVSKIVAGKMRLNVRPVDLAPLLRDALTTVAPAAEAKGVRLQGIIDSAAPRISGDPDRLQQIVWNLLSNAVKFTPRGGRVQLRLERVNSHLEIVVSDTGAGIPSEFLPHVFERFRQADSRFARQHGGLGLGLSIVKQLVELHGGSITAASDGPGRGATFRLKLPLLIVHQETLEPERVHPAAVSLGPLDAAVRLDDVRVLVVDDEPDSLGLVREILAGAGAQVLTADSGAAALRVLDARAVDVLLTDVGMPELDGFALVAAIRASPHAAIRTLPAAALTAYARSEDRVRALRSGFQMHLAKPISPPELIAAVRALARRG